MKDLILATAGLILMTMSCNGQREDPKETMNTTKTESIFPQGQKGLSDYFTGDAYNYPLVDADSIYTTLAGHVHFEPGARSHWHSHPAGQILMVTSGVGYHQIEGQPLETIKKGDVIKCPPNTKHWHGASADHEMTHIYIIPNTENGIVEWMEPVTDQQYHSNQ